MSGENFVTHLEGDALSRGIQHGEQCRDALRQFADDGLCRLQPLSDRPLSLEGLREKIAAYRMRISHWLPEIAREIEGLAMGAGISHELAWLLQLRREVLGYNRITTGGDCSTLASLKSESLVAQTVDLNGNLDDFIRVLHVSTSQQRSLVLSFAGLLGYLGMNSAGLAIGLNMVLGGKWQEGIPPYLAIRHLLDTCTSVDEALETLAALPLSSSRSFTFCDGERAACVESLNNQLRIVEQGVVTAHTNHFLYDDFIPQDAINIFARNSSRLRLEQTRAFLQQPAIRPESCFDLFSTPPVCVADSGDIRRERTVAAVVLLPQQGTMLLRAGNPSLSATHSFFL
ncbi:C45 family autoproteolytic acyltransferase/hydolase [Lonsdalea populi]|uniref:C45 family autoproteolytic acyltransferase/hydolase n=1 Tax=Lonsdalea populi TaxID=1172565 RepID=UPI000A232D38|nr:C45 family peptidase [Lonsdalea populi]OSM94732.1 peptidase C45 [Lonsdalea populi]RAT67139.1 peptidase C45 [Lonsdalea populi]RAT71804.1 peptidase C45 [Lonsdalea populi]RAT75740.1 peptidase C45 [Lonsdalea populi]RAT76265.1 peptidase C45 [Lonsdalea populi]